MVLRLTLGYGVMLAGPDAKVNAGYGGFVFPGIAGGWFAAMQADDSRVLAAASQSMRLHEDTTAFMTFGCNPQVVEFLVADGNSVFELSIDSEVGALFVDAYVSHGNADDANND